LQDPSKLAQIGIFWFENIPFGNLGQMAKLFFFSCQMGNQRNRCMYVADKKTRKKSFDGQLGGRCYNHKFSQFSHQKVSI
jgi:hypothetical protein